MKAITILQPWAHLIVHGPKRIENRTWWTKYRGPLAIHAAKSRRMLDALDDGTLRAHVERTGYQMPVVGDLVFGAIIGTAQLTDIVEVSDVPDDPFATGPLCWILEHREPLDAPILCAGRRMLWDVPCSIVKASEPSLFA